MAPDILTRRIYPAGANFPGVPIIWMQCLEVLGLQRTVERLWRRSERCSEVVLQEERGKYE
jgi:hypothetical protein